VIGKCYIYLAVLLALQVIPTDLFASIVSPVVIFLWQYFSLGSVLQIRP
jgi:hypothetical protein